MLLLELFQLDQPDLDFGLYRVMHARRHEVTQFLDKDLLPQVKTAFAQYTTANKAEIEKELAKAVEQARALGVDPSATQKVKDLSAKLADDAVDIDALEAEVYDHLFSFFRRYYSEGDFLSKRVYKSGVYAIPYEGEEVKLHWANADQYYIKTSEYLRDYAFRLRPDDEANPMRVHFRLVGSAEGEHGTVQEHAGKERRFKLAADSPVTVENAELIVRFTYLPDVAKQKALNAATEAALLGLTEAALRGWIQALGANHVRADGTASESTRLRVHLDRYTARNTFDYFIHKDLGAFLRRELDFFIKNEVMHLDDVESESVARVEQYLSKIKVIRRIAGKIIEFLAQLEEFQKKLWLKKKFVLETSYCIRLGVIPEDFYPEIAANDTQREEWVRLCAIDQIRGNLTTPGYSVPLTSEFLRASPTLVIDTSLFSLEWSFRLLQSLEVQRQPAGTLIHSENFQALRLIATRYNERVQTIYIDPPYNTDASAIVYKNDYKDSSWLALLENRLTACRRLIDDNGIVCIAIDDTEAARLKLLLDEVFSRAAVVGVAVVRSNPAGRSTPKGFAEAHDYAFFVANSEDTAIGRLPRNERQLARYGERDEKGAFEWVNFRKHGGREATRVARPRMFFPVFARVDGGVRLPRMEWDATAKKWNLLEDPGTDETPVLPLRGDEELRWKWGPESFAASIQDFRARPGQDGSLSVYMKSRVNEEGMLPLTWWDDREYSATEYGTNLLTDIFGRIADFSFPKALKLVVDCLRVAGANSNSLVLDYFGGSGTTGHAVMFLNREDGGRREFVLVEQGAYFDSVIIPRLKKITYTPEWKSGKPGRFATPEEAQRSTHVLKVIRLESYEDALNNLELRRTKEQQALLELEAGQGVDKFREQYMLRYMLDVETRGSQSLLNVAAFIDPTAYKLKVRRSGSDESREVSVDLLETFNWLIGLTVHHITAPRTFTAQFKREVDQDLPNHAPRRLLLSGGLKEDPNGPWWFRNVTGTDPDGRKTLIIWRKRPGGDSPEGVEEDNRVLDEWFTTHVSEDSAFDVIYVNGGNNLENLKASGDTWKVRLIEEDFHRLMFDTDGL